MATPRSLSSLGVRQVGAFAFAFVLSLAVAQEPTPVPPAAPVVTAAPFLYRVELPTPCWLFGTIHLADERVTALPAPVQQVVDGCDALATEVAMEMPAMMKSAEQALLPAGTELASVLGEPLFRELSEYVESKGVSMAMMKRMRPWAIASQLSSLSQLKKSGARQALDMRLYNGAKKAKKSVFGLETLDEQFAMFAGLTEAEQVRMVKATLADMHRYEAAGKDPTEVLLASYLSGDEAALGATLADFLRDDGELQKKLLTRMVDDRNERMADRIVRRLQEHPAQAQVFAVGAAHLIGANGIPALLRARGYQVTRVVADAKAAAQAEAAALDAAIAAQEAALAKLRARREARVPAAAGR